MNHLFLHFKGLSIAVVALALSASLAFGAQTPAAGYALGTSFQAGTDESAGDEDVNDTEDTETDETADESSDSADNCRTDPTGLTEEQLAAMSHGSIVCWAAQQDTPDGYDNHGAWVSHWAHLGKANDAAATGKAHGQGHGSGLGKGNRRGISG